MDAADTDVLDLFCGPGGVGRALSELGLRHVGVDCVDYGAEYPGPFVQADASRPPLGEVSPKLVWASPPCLRYSKLNKSLYSADERRERHPSIEDLRVREVIQDLDPDHYIIENVVTCEDLRDPTKLNGRGFGLPFHQERWFETSYSAPDCRETPQGAGDRSEIPIGGYRNRGDQADRKGRLARAKKVPETWTESRVISAIPRQYVRYLLSYCPAFNVAPPVEVESPQQTLTGVL